MPLNVRKFGFACGMAGGLFYLGCVLIMAIVGRDSLVVFFNSIMHGIDLEPILEMNIGFAKTVFGLVNTIALSWLFGGLVAALYNLPIFKGDKDT